jgi:gamma-glutamylcyclotransferase (GGCT)/AIG2-like uncharacterized protein YtfP
MARLLFVYGTLRDPDVLGLVLGRTAEAGQMRPATAAGYRVVVFPGRTYPGLRRAAGAIAVGTLLTGLSAADLDLLDRFEGEEYRRGPIELIVSGAAARADVYWPAQSIPADAADWRLPDWTRRYKAGFLATEAESLAELRRHLTDLPRAAAGAPPQRRKS